MNKIERALVDWIDETFNDFYTLWWGKDCEKHIVNNSECFDTFQFVELVKAIYNKKVGYDVFTEGIVGWESDIDTFTFYLADDSEIKVDCIDHLIHYPQLVPRRIHND